MELSLKIGRFGVTLGAGAASPAEKIGRAQAVDVNEWEQRHGAEPPFDLSQPPKGYRNVSWVYACVRAITTAAQGVPLRTYRERGGESRLVEDDPVTRLFWDVNPHMSRADLWEWTVGSLELSGNSYWEIERNGRGVPVALYPLIPANVKIVPDKKDFVRGYLYTVNGREIALEKDDVFHLRYWNPESQHYGLGPYQAATRIVTIDTWAQKYNERFFQSDATPGGVLETDEDLDEETAKSAKRRWEEVHRGRNRAFKIAVLTSGLAYKPISPTMKDMLFPDLRKMNREEICAMFGVPPGVVGILDYANYANLKEQQAIFWKNKMAPLLKKIQEALNQAFIPYFKDSSLYVEFDLSNVEALREDQSEKAKREETLVRAGLRTINELRAEDNLPPVPWGDEPPAQGGGIGMLGLERELQSKGRKFGDTTEVMSPISSVKARERYSVERQMRLLYTPARELFRDLGKEMIRYLKSDHRVAKLRAYAETSEPDEGERDRNRDREIVEGLFSGFDWHKNQRKRIDADFAEPQKTLYEKGARFAARKLRLAAGKALPFMGKKSFELVDPNILKWLSERREFWIGRGLEETYDALRLVLVDEYFDKWKDATDAQLLSSIQRVFEVDATWRAERISRTETQIVGQNSQREMFGRALVRFYEWRHSGNPNGRENHMALDGTVINLDEGERFQVGSYLAEGPGDPSLGPEEVINCECDTWPAIEKAGEGYALPDELWDGS